MDANKESSMLATYHFSDAMIEGFHEIEYSQDEYTVGKRPVEKIASDIWGEEVRMNTQSDRMRHIAGTPHAM